MPAALGEVLAHEGGWDEILLVAGPIVVLGAILWLANRRADRMAGADRDDDRRLDQGKGPRG